jgi:hypothetical protein
VKNTGDKDIILKNGAGNIYFSDGQDRTLRPGEDLDLFMHEYIITDKPQGSSELDLIRTHDPVQLVLYEEVSQLLRRARALVTALDESETHHGGLLTVDMIRLKNELRLELSNWKTEK